MDEHKYKVYHTEKKCYGKVNEDGSFKENENISYSNRGALIKRLEGIRNMRNDGNERRFHPEQYEIHDYSMTYQGARTLLNELIDLIEERRANKLNAVNEHKFLSAKLKLIVPSMSVQKIIYAYNGKLFLGDTMNQLRPIINRINTLNERP